MKKILIPVITVAITLFVYSSCTNTTEDLFDKSASERISESAAIAHQVLKSASNGWLVEYYPERNQKYGGFNLYFKFNEATTIVKSEVNPALSEETIYQMLSDRGPTVNFTEYNNILHYFSNPALLVGGGKGLGYEGDYEFVVQKATEEEVILMGKKTRNKIRLTPFTGVSWVDHCAKIETSRDATYVVDSMFVSGAKMGSITKTDNFRYTITHGSERVVVAFILTTTGIRLYEPITIAGKTMQNFAINAAGHKLVCTDPGVNAEIYYSAPLLTYGDLIGTYTLRYSTSNAQPPNRNRSATVTMVQNIVGQTYFLKGILTPADEAKGNIIVKYSPSRGIAISGQILFVRENTGYDFWWLPYSRPETGNYVSRSTTPGMYSTNVDNSGKLKFDMVDDGFWVSYVVAGFILRDYQSSTSMGNINGKDGQPYYFYPQFEKQ